MNFRRGNGNRAFMNDVIMHTVGQTDYIYRLIILNFTYLINEFKKFNKSRGPFIEDLGS